MHNQQQLGTCIIHCAILHHKHLAHHEQHSSSVQPFFFGNAYARHITMTMTCIIIIMHVQIVHNLLLIMHAYARHTIIIITLITTIMHVQIVDNLLLIMHAYNKL